jgi:hypothetical protein
MSYPPTPTNKSCNCSDPCISTDDVYYAGPNLPNSGVNTNNSMTVALEKIDNKISAESILEAIAADPTLRAQLCAIINQC